MKKKAKGALCLLLTGLLWLTGCGSSFSDEVIARIDGREVMKSEYMVYLYTSTQSFVSAAGSDVWDMDFDGMTGAELVQERAFSTIQSVVAAEQYAEENNISLTEDQKTEAHTMAEEFLSQLTEEDLAKMGVDEEQDVYKRQGRSSADGYQQKMPPVLSENNKIQLRYRWSDRYRSVRQNSWYHRYR